MGWGTSWDKAIGKDIGITPELLGVKDEAAKSRVNLVPTHDPYTNPGAYLYYECDCGKVLDPKVKRFASLNNHASDAGWKIRFGEKHYVPYCPECAEKKGIE